MNYELDDKSYDALLNDMDRDRAIGKHNFMVVGGVTEGEWGPGRPYFEVAGVLTTNNSMQFKFRLNAPDSAEAIKEEKSVGRQRGMLLNIKSWKALKTLGKKSPLDLRDGDEFQVEIYREKPKEGRDIGFLKLSHIIGPAKEQNMASGSDPGF